MNHSNKPVNKKDVICFNCRQPGHLLRDCKKPRGSTSICYNCGSHDHCLRDCPEPRKGDLPFASCFVCHQTGHISRDCPLNPRGIYPNGGGCKFCGSVNHFAKDCPERRKRKEAGDDDDDYLTTKADFEKAPKKPASDKKEPEKKVKKVVRF